MTRTPVHRLGAVLAGCLLAVSTLAAPIPMNPEQRAAAGVEVAPAAPVQTTFSRLYPAQVAVPNASLRVVSAPQGGLLEALLVAEGDPVAAGQPLARVRSPELLGMQRDYLETRTRHELAAANLQRDRQLFEEGIIAERRYLASRADRQELAATLEQRRQALALAGLEEAEIGALERERTLSDGLTVRAPLAGVVLEQLATAGQRVQAADPLYRVARLDTLWLEVHVPLEQLGGVAVGDAVQVPELEIGATLVTVGRMVHGSDQGVLLRAEVREGSAKLRPGQFVQARIAVAAGASRFRVPRGALVRDGGSAYVFVAEADGFAARPVTVVAEEAQDLVVEGALDGGAPVAVAGTAALKAAWQGGEE